MEYSISIRINMKKNLNHVELENLIYDIGNSYNSINIYKDFDLDGINKFIKNNNMIIILEFEEEINLINFIKFIKKINNIEIEYIYEKNNIIYGDKKYINNIENNKNLLIDKINKNNESNKYKNILNLL